MTWRRALIAAGTAALLLAPGLAHADPVDLFFILGASFEVGAAVITVKSALAFVTIVYGASSARRKQRKAQAAARAAYNANLQDRSVTALQATPPWRIVYGRCVTGGDVHAIFTTDKTATREDGSSFTRYDAYKHLVIAIADHECEAVHEVYIDGVAVGALDGSGWATTGEFVETRTETRSRTVAASSYIDVPEAVVTVLGARAETWTNDNYGAANYTLSIGNTRITNNDSNFALVIDYTCSVVRASVRVSKHLGTASQAVDAYLTGVAPAQWTSTDRLLDICYCTITLDLENQRFQGGPPNFTFDVSGRKLFDTRSSTTAWGADAALVLRDWLTAEWGGVAAAGDIDTAYCNAAANACEVRASAAAQSYSLAFTAAAATDLCTTAADHVWATGDGVRVSTTTTLPAPLAAATTYYAIQQPDRLNVKLATSRANALAGTAIDITSAGSGTHTMTWHDYDTFTCNGVITTDQSREAVLEDLAECMAGYAVYGAQWQIIAGAWTASVMDLTDDDLVGQAELVQADVGMADLLNSMRGTYIAAGKAVPAEFDNYSNATFVAADGVELWADAALPFTNAKARARNLARVFVERGRNGQVLRYPAKLRAWPLQLGDRVRVTNAEYGLTLKYYRVTDWQFGLTSPVVLTLQEDDSTVYDLADAASADPTANTGLPNPNVLAALSGLTATVETVSIVRHADGNVSARVKVAWNAIADAYVTSGTGRVYVSWRPDGKTTWQTISVPGDQLAAYVEPVGVLNTGKVIIAAHAHNGYVAGPDAYTSVSIVAQGAAGGNLLDASTWLLGSSGTQGLTGGSLFTRTAADSDNNIIFDTAPDGVKRMVWEAKGVNSGTEGGGFYTGYVPIDRTKQYRWSLCIQASVISGAVGTTYLGTNVDGSVVDIATGTPNTNPYFQYIVRNLLVPGRWYRFFGNVLPASFGTTPPSPTLGGVYDVVTGQRVAAGVDFKWGSAAVQAYMRTFLYYADSSQRDKRIWPRLEMCDGSEPSIDALLAEAKAALTDTIAPDFETQYALNGQFTNWVIGATYPDGWSGSGGTVSKETTTTRVGPNALRIVSSGSTANAQRDISFGSVPLAAGGFLEGTLDLYLVSHTSGGYPGLAIKLWTNSGHTTSEYVYLNLPATTTGAWQTIAFKASASAGAQIYGAVFYACASEASLSGGNGTSDVIFDSLVVRVQRPSDTAQLVDGAATSTAQNATGESFDDAAAYPTPNANHYNPYSTYTHGDGLRGAGSVTTNTTVRTNITVTGTIRVHCGNTSVDKIVLVINLRNGTTVIDAVNLQATAFSWTLDPVGAGKVGVFPFSLSWQGDLSADTTFNVDTSHTTYNSSDAGVYWNDDATDPSYVRFDYKSSIVLYKK